MLRGRGRVLTKELNHDLAKRRNRAVRRRRFFDRERNLRIVQKRRAQTLDRAIVEYSTICSLDRVMIRIGPRNRNHFRQNVEPGGVEHFSIFERFEHSSARRFAERLLTFRLSRGVIAFRIREDATNRRK